MPHAEREQVEERATRIRQLRQDIVDQSNVAARLPAGHPAHSLYTDRVTALADELHHLETGHTYGVYGRATGLVALGALVASSGVWTGILLGGFLATVAAALVIVHNLDR